MNTTHVYLLIGNNWAYPGRSVDPSKRLLVHLRGECKTTAPRIFADAASPIMVPMEAYDFDLDDEKTVNGEARLLDDVRAGKHIPEGYEVLCAVYPYYSKKALQKTPKPIAETAQVLSIQKFELRCAPFPIPRK